MIKKGGMFIVLDNFILNSGDQITFEAKILSNKPWFNIIQESQFSSSSFYDGPDYERAKDMYKELLIAFKGVKRAENTHLPNYEKISKDLNIEKDKYSNLYESLKSNPLFLGMNDF